MRQTGSRVNQMWSMVRQDIKLNEREKELSMVRNTGGLLGEGR